MSNDSYIKNRAVEPEVLSLGELDSVLHDLSFFSDFSIGCYSLRSRDNIEPMLENGISLKNKNDMRFKDEVKYMGLVRDVPISKLEGYHSNVILSEDGKTCVELNAVILIPPFIHNYYSKSHESNDYFLGHYPATIDEFNCVNNVDLVYLLENRIGRIPKEFILGYIEKISNLTKTSDVKTRFVTNLGYYTNLSNHDKASVDYEFIKNISISRLLSLYMQPSVFNEVSNLIELSRSFNKNDNSNTQDEYINWNVVQKAAKFKKSSLNFDRSLQDSYNKQLALLKELKGRPQLNLREIQYLKYFNPNEKVLSMTNQNDIYKNLEGMTLEDYKRSQK